MFVCWSVTRQSCRVEESEVQQQVSAAAAQSRMHHQREFPFSHGNPLGMRMGIYTRDSVGIPTEQCSVVGWPTDQVSNYALGLNSVVETIVLFKLG